MAAFQVTWIDKPGGSYNPHNRILRLGGPGWAKTEPQVIQEILNNLNSYYVQQGLNTTYVVVGYRLGVPYLRTQSDGTPLDNLLSLTNVSTAR